jgi:hypothetical protein
MCNIEVPKSLVLRGEAAVSFFETLFSHSKSRPYLEERTKQREFLDSQIANLERLLKDNSIDESTYTRYKKLLEMNYEQKREETREKHCFTKPDGTEVAS